MTLDRERDKATLAYGVGQDYEKFWTRAKSTHHACIMPVFDTNDCPINPDHFANKLVGALCEVTFTLKHYAINAQKKEGDQDVQAHDIFSAQVETVALLKNPPTIVRSPYKGRLTRRPQHRPQIPTRGEQVNAAAAFVSHPDFDSTSDSANSGAQAQAPATTGTATSIVPIVPTPINTPPPYAAQPSTSELASAASAASSITASVTSESDEEVRSITQLSSLKRKLAD